MRELDVVGVRVEMPSNAPMVLLREVGGTRYLPIWIGAAEAAAIANAQEGIVPPRPLTHDLMVDTLTTLGHRLTEVQITELEGGTFYAVLLVDGIEVSARPVGRHRPCAAGRALTSTAPRTCSMRPASRFQKPKMTRWRSSGSFSIRSIPTTSSLVKSQSPSQQQHSGST